MLPERARLILPLSHNQLRVGSSLVLTPIVVGAVSAGGLWLFILVEAAGVVGLLEFYRLSHRTGVYPAKVTGIAILSLFFLSQYLGQPKDFPLPPLVIGGSILFLAYILSVRHSPAVVETVTHTIGGALYLGLLGLALSLRNLTYGLWWTLLTLGATFATDIGSFVTGKTIGRHHLVPRISPNKTWEGAIGGLSASLASTILIGIFSPLNLSLGQAIVLGLIIGILVEVGDLLESMLKRRAGVKDSGQIIPGHGGLLDRIDGLVFAIAGVYNFATVVW